MNTSFAIPEIPVQKSRPQNPSDEAGIKLISVLYQTIRLEILNLSKKQYAAQCISMVHIFKN